MTARAVISYQEVVESAPKDADAARAELARYCEDTIRRYIADPERKPTTTEIGSYWYRGPAPLRLRLVITKSLRDEKPRLVDVLPESDRGTGRSAAGRTRQSKMIRRVRQGRVICEACKAKIVLPDDYQIGNEIACGKCGGTKLWQVKR